VELGPPTESTKAPDKAHLWPGLPTHGPGPCRWGLCLDWTPGESRAFSFGPAWMRRSARCFHGALRTLRALL